MKTFKSTSSQATMELGKTIGKQLPQGSLLYLHGDIGLGKTVFTKGIALALGIQEVISSPTFTIVKEYPGLVHIDAYRFEGVDPSTIGLDDFLDDTSIIVIEWAEFVEALGLNPALIITFEHVSENERLITIEGALSHDLIID